MSCVFFEPTHFAIEANEGNEQADKDNADAGHHHIKKAVAAQVSIWFL